MFKDKIVTENSDIHSIYSTDTLATVLLPLETVGHSSTDSCETDKTVPVENNSDLGPLTSSDASLNDRKTQTISPTPTESPTASKSWLGNMSKSEEAELNAKLKHLDKDIVHLDFLFAQKGVEKIAVIVETEKAKVEQALKEMANVIFKKLFSLIKGISTSDDKQLNYYSELLRTPNERATSESSMLTNNSILSIKVINKKMIASRMHKIKADLYLLLNLVDSALVNYSNSYAQGKKEVDNGVWTMSALEGLCVASYIYLNETRQLSNGGQTANTGPINSGSRNSVITLGRPSQGDLSQSCKLNRIQDHLFSNLFE